ncbi:MAG: tRNA dihydrouridine synthase DusB [Chloroflexaceae bacterium]|nr:tRNA dihydrouridine synthase DusB [Chloroflexaceae bacterium]
MTTIQQTAQDGYGLPYAYQVETITIQPNIVLAPMAGVTDSLFRRMIQQIGGCGLVSSEMTNAASVTPKALKHHGLLDYLPEERPITMQLSGNDPDLMARAAQTVEALGADILDINCGCPSPKVTGGGHGASLLRDLPRLSLVLQAVRKAVSIPVTLKFRAGWDERNLNYLETARRAEDAGIAALALHPRTREQRYTGEADWERIAQVKQAVSIAVIGSGDVQDAADALHRLTQSGVDGVMIGRAAIANPWIFRQVEQLRHGEAVFQPSPADKYHLLCAYLSACEAEMNPRLALNRLKQLIGQLHLGLPGSAALRSTVQRSQSTTQARLLLDHAFAGYLDTGVPPPEDTFTVIQRIKTVASMVQ